ncbi:MAG: bcsA1 [Marmoricola sp.]|nr:bcsA1 [Marmoricola sp.]
MTEMLQKPSDTVTRAIPAQRSPRRAEPAPGNGAGPAQALRDLAPGLQASDQVTPPSDEELYAYLGPQMRWVQWVMSSAFVLASLSLARFAGNGWFLYPLYAVLGLNLFGMLLSALSGWNRREITASSHFEKVRTWMAAKTYPTVDVFLPTCGESLGVLENTYRHVGNMRWGSRVTVWVLDDADRPEVAALVSRFGYRYVVRPNRGYMKKAGNLQYAYEHSSSDVIAIFDADFCPRPDYLMHLMPYLDDPEVGIVQSPQYFPTTTSMNWLERTAGATQELFYRWVQPSRDALGAAICVGTCALYRRQALEATDGFAQIEHSEDVHTGIFLLRAGFRTKYVPVVVAKGLCPDELAGFLNQQYRWCNGSITLLNSGKAHTRPLTFRQRMCFWAGFMYYVTTAVNVFAIHVPGLLMAVFYPEDVRALHFVPFMLGVWVYFVLLPRVSVTHWRFEVLRVQTAYSFCHALAITHKIFGRTKAWVATGAVGRSSSLSRTVAVIGSITLTVTMGVPWVALVRDIGTYGLTDFWAMTMFLLGYTYICAPLLLEFLRVLGLLPARRPREVVRSGQSNAFTRVTLTENIAVTLVIGFAISVAMGWFDASLIWGATG